MNYWVTAGQVVLLSLVAGMGTALGGLLAIIRVPGRRLFGFMMGMAAGVMITLSFLELVNTAWELKGFWTATLGFAAGAVFMLLIDIFIPHIRFGELEGEVPQPPTAITANQPGMDTAVCPRDLREPKGRRFHGKRRFQGRHRRNQIVDPKLLKTGLLIAVGITIHNIPEGIAVGAGYMHEARFGFFIALANLLHNIPEGIATALPLCKSGVCRWDAFRVSLFSGMAEPVGALLAALFLSTFEAFIPAALAFAGGVMVFITLDELIPVAREYGHQHFTASGIILGAVFVFILSGLFGV